MNQRRLVDRFDADRLRPSELNDKVEPSKSIDKVEPGTIKNTITLYLSILNFLFIISSKPVPRNQIHQLQEQVFSQLNWLSVNVPSLNINWTPSPTEIVTVLLFGEVNEPDKIVEPPKSICPCINVTSVLPPLPKIVNFWTSVS